MRQVQGRGGGLESNLSSHLPRAAGGSAGDGVEDSLPQPGQLQGEAGAQPASGGGRGLVRDSTLAGAGLLLQRSCGDANGGSSHKAQVLQPDYRPHGSDVSAPERALEAGGEDSG